LTTTVFTQPQVGQVCMKGAVAGPDGYVWLIATVSRWNKGNNHIVDVFDAKALGITGLQFTIDHPPNTGMSMFATTVKKRDCALPGECLDGWNLMTGPRSNLVKVLDQSETVNAAFVDFASDDPNARFDPSVLGHFIFVVLPASTTSASPTSSSSTPRGTRSCRCRRRPDARCDLDTSRTGACDGRVWKGLREFGAAALVVLAGACSIDPRTSSSTRGIPRPRMPALTPTLMSSRFAAASPSSGR